jgi:SAM-dependent methyltransferase
MERVPLYHEQAEFYDRIYAEKDYAGEAARLTRRIRRWAPSARTLLDVACGTGRHLEAFRREFDVAGIDASGPMLAVARRRLGRGPVLRRGDMRAFDLQRQFDAIVCLFSAIGYLRSPRDRTRTFANFYRHLVPGGVALVEGWILPSEFLGDSVHLQTVNADDLKIARVSRSRRRKGSSEIEMRYLVAGPKLGFRTWSEIHRNALVPPGEMLEEMRAAGFEASAITTGEYRQRALYVGRRPKATASDLRVRGQTRGRRASQTGEGPARGP